MKIQKIKFADIVIQKPAKEDRVISKEFTETLAKSIDSEGLLSEPIVRPIKDSPGKFKVISGNHRAIACGKLLKWESIPCKVVPDSMTDEEARAIEIADNMFRNNLDEVQLAKALSDWHAIYIKKHPLSAEKAVGPKREKIVAAKIAEEEAKGVEVTEEKKEEIVQAVAAESKPFAKVLQETLKVSAATAGRLARKAKFLDATQIDILANNKATNDTCEQIAGLESKDLIDRAIALIASGMDHGEAVRQASKVKGERKAAEKAKEPPTAEQKRSVPKAPKAPPKPKETELTDEDWLAQRCDVVLKNLTRKAAFKRDAILYRRLADLLPKLRGSTKKALAEAKNADGNGAFFAVLNKLVRAAHPSNWLVCGECNGKGSILGPGEDGKEAKLKCPGCYGAAYKLKLED